MAPRSRFLQLEALLEIVFEGPVLIIAFLLSILTFPMFETLQTIGMEKENAEIFVNNTKFIPSELFKETLDPIMSKVPIHPPISILFLILDILVIWCAAHSKFDDDDCRKRREEIGPFLYGLNGISLAVSNFTLCSLGAP